MSGDELTDEERRAIASLQRLAKRWPKSLTLFSWSGSLVVYHTADKDQFVLGGVEANDLILEAIDGIPNDGGDP